MGARQGARRAVVAALAGAVLVAGPAHVGRASQAYDPAIAEQAVPGDPCAVPPGGEAPLMCQSGVVVPDEAEPAPVPEPEDRLGLLAATGAGVVLAGAGALVLARRRRPSGLAT